MRHRIWSGEPDAIMRPSILILEPRPDVAAALEDVVNSANYVAIVAPHLERISDLEVPPAAIIVRISFEGASEPPHAALERLRDRPPVVAIVWEDEEIAEATRLGCEVVLKAPREVSKLCEALGRIVGT
jgi:hypothetical protein